VAHTFLIVVAILKVSVWVAIGVVAWRQRRLLPAIYAPLGVFVQTVRGLSDTHEHALWTVQAAAFIATPIACMILASLLVTKPISPIRGGRWSL
jgi:hypothetical protein